MSSKYFHAKHIQGKKLGRHKKQHVGDYEKAKYHKVIQEKGPSKGKQKLKKDQQNFIATVKNVRDIERENQQPHTKCTTYSEVRGPGRIIFVFAAFVIAGRETDGGGVSPHHLHGPVEPVRNNVNSAISPPKGIKRFRSRGKTIYDIDETTDGRRYDGYIEKGNTETVADVWSIENLNNEHYANQEKMDMPEGPDYWFDPPVEKFTEDKATKR